MIYLCGFMGSGKTTLRKKLAQGKAGFDFDEEIARRQGIRADELGLFIENVGFDEFRSLEQELVVETLKGPKDGFYALGGGTLFFGSCLELLQNDKSAQVFWVNTPVSQCWDRVKNDQNRPLVQKGESEFLRLYKERERVYQLFEIFDESYLSSPA